VSTKKPVLDYRIKHIKIWYYFIQRSHRPRGDWAIVNMINDHLIRLLCVHINVSLGYGLNTYVLHTTYTMTIITQINNEKKIISSFLKFLVPTKFLKNKGFVKTF